MGRFGWGFGDQALSSLTNFALGILVARSVTTEEFGAFGLALVTYWTALAVGRAMASEPLAIRYSGVSVDKWRQGAAAATGTMLLVALPVGLVSLVAGLLIGGVLGSAFVALGFVLPGLLVQDCWRFAFLAAGRGRSAVANDLVWAIVLLPSLALVLAATEASLLLPILAWGGAAGVAALYGCAQARLLPRPDRARWWLREQRDLVGRYTGAAIVVMGLQQAGSYVIASLGGLRAVGTLRSGDLLLSPLNVLFQGIGLIGVPEGVRALRRSARHFLRVLVVMGVGLAAIVVAWGAVLVLVPTDVGRQIVGPAWDSGWTVLLPKVLVLAFGGITSAAWVGLRSLAAASRSVRASVVGSVTLFLAVVGGVSLGGAVGVAWAVFVVAVFMTAVYWAELRGALIDYRRTGGGTAAAAVGPAPHEHSGPVAG